ncbi:MAG: FAD:protein FMN transferase [Clostridia bacterium]|nr:FAD:protein FMN transferase [Clostridia bacterium]
MLTECEKGRRPIISGFAVKLAAAIMLLAALVTACGCTHNGPLVRELFAMDTYMRFSVYGLTDGEAVDEAADAVMRLSRLFDATDSRSEVYALDHGAGLPVPVSPETFDVIEGALGLSHRLGSAFELTVRPVLTAWGFTEGEHRIPSDAELAALIENVDDGRVGLDAERNTVTLPEGMQIDLGAVAKGYAADEAARILREGGAKAALLDLGSSTILAFGSKPDGTKWKIAVKDPENADGVAGIIETDGGAVSTSGGYERYFTGPDGQVYWHIIDPRTGRPAKTGILSVTVLTDDAMTGDALSTALFVMGPQAAEEYYRENGGFDFIMLMEDGSIVMTAGAEGVFTPYGSRAGAKVSVVEP